MVWLHARSWRAHCHFVLNSTKREAIKKETAQTSYGGNGKKHPLVRLEARKIEGEHCALRKGSFEGQAMVTIYFFVGTYIYFFVGSRKSLFFSENPTILRISRKNLRSPIGREHSRTFRFSFFDFRGPIRNGLSHASRLASTPPAALSPVNRAVLELEVIQL